MGLIIIMLPFLQGLHWQLRKSNVLYLGSITHTFLIFLYLDYHRWTYITTYFLYHSRSFDIRNASQKKSDIFTPTKHFDCNQLWVTTVEK